MYDIATYSKLYVQIFMGKHILCTYNNLHSGSKEIVKKHCQFYVYLSITFIGHKIYEFVSPIGFTKPSMSLNGISKLF